jgi:hexosaminidase
VVALPEIASAPGPYVIERHWGVFNPVLDPTNEKTYAVLDQFLGEMAALFPDPYLHIGGDENNGVQWKANPRIQAFIREHGLNDNAGLHAYFNRRVRDILQKHGKKLIGWDEILHPDLPKDSVIHSWRGAKGLAAAAKQGFTAILSNGYYIDLNHPAADHYRNDPIPATTTLSVDEQQRILGGEATMWAEWVTPETIDSRIWPRTAAIAERLWSPRETTDIEDMYRRLAIVSARLDEAGLQHERNRPGMIRRFAGDGASPELVRALTQLVDVIEPVKGYARNQQQHHLTQLSPLTGLADMARPESDQVRELRRQLELAAKTSPEAASAREQVRQTLTHWRAAAQKVIREAATASPRVQTETVPVATSLSALCDTGLELMAADTNGAEAKAADEEAVRTVLSRHKHPGVGVEIPLASALESLLGPAKPLTPP